MVQFVGKNRVRFAEQRFEQPAVGVEAGDVQDAVALAEVVGDRAFELFVDVLRAADEADRGEAEAPVVEAATSRRDNLRMVGQAEIVISAEVHHVLVVNPNGRLLGRFDAAFRFVKPLGFQVVELGTQMRVQGARKHMGSGIAKGLRN